MSTRAGIARRSALLLCVAVAACDLGAPSGPAGAAPLGADGAPTMHVPAAAPARRARSVDEALETFPSVDAVRRDPFLTRAEEEAEARQHLPADAPVVAPPPVKKATRKKVVAELETVELELTALTGTRDGRRHAVAKDRKTGRDVQIDEGQTFGDFVVTSISDEAIHLKEREGPATRDIPFRRAAAESIWQRKGKQ